MFIVCKLRVTSIAKRLLIITISFILFSLTGCAQKSEEIAEEPVELIPGSSFTLAYNYLGRGFYPENCKEWLRDNVYEALTFFSSGEDMELSGLIAESWSSSDDHCVWEIVIRENVLFSDGTPCDAQAVASCMEKIYTPELGIKSCEARDNNLLLFELIEPNEEFAADLSEAYICSVSAMELYGAETHLGVVGTGPYMLSEYSQTSALLRANPDYYFAPRSPQVEEIRFIMVDENNDTEKDLERFINGETDYVMIESTYKYTADYLERIEEAVPDANVAKSQGLIGCIWMNGDYDPRFKDRDFRLAISRFIDFDALNEAQCEGEGWAVYGLWPEGCEGYVENEEYCYNPAKGRRTLKKLGLKPEEIELDIRVYTLYEDSFEDMVIEMLRAEGFKVNVAEHGIHWATTGVGDLYESSLLFSSTTLRYSVKGRVSPFWWGAAGEYFYDKELYKTLLAEVDSIAMAKNRAAELEHLENITRYVQDDIATLGGVCYPLYIVTSPGFTGLDVVENVPLFYTLRVE